MDLKNLDTLAKADAGSELHLLHPATGVALIDEKTDEFLSITLLGVDSAAYRRAQHDLQTRQIQRMARAGRQGAAGEDLEEDNVEMLSMITKSWKHIVLNGEELECTPANARRLYSEPGLRWIREQANAFINNRANFLGNSQAA